jgi:hypothetical protein
MNPKHEAQLWLPVPSCHKNDPTTSVLSLAALSELV